MSLEELEQEWEGLEGMIDQDFLSDHQIDQSLQKKRRNWLGQSLLYETLLLLSYCYFGGLILFRFDVLEKGYLEGIGFFSVAALGLLLIFRLFKLNQLIRLGMVDQTHADYLRMIHQYQIQINRFFLWNTILGFFLVMSILILMVKIYNEYDITQNPYFWLLTIPVSFLFIFLVNRWIRNHYTSAVEEARAILNELK